ncbi:hypothetical protein ACSTIN_12900 [Vibrio parahaemolyticus]
MEKSSIAIDKQTYNSFSDIADCLQQRQQIDLDYMEAHPPETEYPEFLEKAIENIVIYALEHRLDGNTHFLKTLMAKRNVTLSLGQLFGLQNRQINKIARSTCINYLKSLEDGERF